MAIDRFDGRTVLLTGPTGFIGQALLERLLSAHPGTRVVLLIRGRPGVTAGDRLAELFAKPVFGPWRERVGAEEADRQVRERVQVVEADISQEVPELPHGIDAVIHGASIVSFDPPVDDAFQTNVVGTMNLYEAARRTGDLPHLVHISTAYVAGDRKGVIPEAPLDHDVDWRRELDWALEARETVERDSRRPELLRRLREQAMHAQRKAGPQAVAEATETRRKELVGERLIDYGRQRARSLGWPDVYTLTKALGERAAEATADGLPLSVVRPAIVESALELPFPGWIDGFKMADPFILAYGRGLLRYVSGIPDGILDIVPVDIVVTAILEAALKVPEDGKPHYYHVGSGARNPLTLQRLAEMVQVYFEGDPLPDAEGRGTISVPGLTFISDAQATRAVATAGKAIDKAEKVLLSLPGGERTRNWQRDLHKRRREVDLLRRYSELYGAYTAAEVMYSDDATLALHHALPEGAPGCDTSVVDWAHYIQEVHCPSVTGLLRFPRDRKPGAAVLTLPERDDVAAIFDLEGTVVASNVVEGYLWMRLLDAPARDWPKTLLQVGRSVPKYLIAEHRDRGEFLRTFLKAYEGASEAELRVFARERLADAMLRRAWPAAIRRIRRHRSAGHRTVLITGAVDFFVEPLRELFDEIVASELRVIDGRCTGRLAKPPVVGEARAAWLHDWAEDEGIDLTGSWAYADHYSDRQVLELVGNPVAVNPDGRLYRHAKQNRWTIEDWQDNVSSAGVALVDAALEAPR